VTADVWQHPADQADGMFSYPIQAALAADRQKTIIDQAEAARLVREFRKLRRRERADRADRADRVDRGARQASGARLRIRAVAGRRHAVGD
jgi:hypothetical protein